MQFIRLDKPVRRWAVAYIYTPKESYKILGELNEVVKLCKDSYPLFWGIIYFRRVKSGPTRSLIITSKELYIKRIYNRPHYGSDNTPTGFLIHKKFLGRWIPLKKLRRLPKNWIREFELEETHIEVAKDLLKDNCMDLACLVFPRPKKKGSRKHGWR